MMLRITTAITFRLVCDHIPLFVVRNVSRVGADGADDCNRQVCDEKSEHPSADNRSLIRCSQFVWVSLPHLIGGDLGVVACECWIQVELKFELSD